MDQISHNPEQPPEDNSQASEKRKWEYDAISIPLRDRKVFHIDPQETVSIVGQRRLEIHIDDESGEKIFDFSGLLPRKTTFVSGSNLTANRFVHEVEVPPISDSHDIMGVLHEIGHLRSLTFAQRLKQDLAMRKSDKAGLRYLSDDLYKAERARFDTRKRRYEEHADLPSETSSPAKALHRLKESLDFWLAERNIGRIETLRQDVGTLKAKRKDSARVFQILKAERERCAWAWAIRAARGIRSEYGIDLLAEFGSIDQFKAWMHSRAALGNYEEQLMEDGWGDELKGIYSEPYHRKYLIDSQPDSQGRSADDKET